MKQPRTAEELQCAVNASAALRALYDCKLYGLIEGGPEINIERCDAILDCGAARGITPNRPIEDLVAELVEEVQRNAEKAS